MKGFDNDHRIVLTLDAGGTNFRFNAVQDGKLLIPSIPLSAKAQTLDDVLSTIRSGFEMVVSQLPEPPSAISFCFPGPADYEAGIIGDLENLPVFRGGVALGPYLEEVFGVPVFINNDGDLFTYGEAIGGILPEINKKLLQYGSPKKYRNLFGATFGTGFGGGIYSRGQLFSGDNSAQGEINRMHNKLYSGFSVEESVSIKGIKRVYMLHANIQEEDCPEPRDIYEIALGNMSGNKLAALKAFEELAVVAGNALADAITLVDGLIVLGGGLSGAYPLFLDRLVQEMNSAHQTMAGNRLERLEIKVFNLEDPAQLEEFAIGEKRLITVPGTTKTISYDPLKRIGVAMSRLGTSEAIALGAWAFALQELNSKS